MFKKKWFRCVVLVIGFLSLVNPVFAKKSFTDAVPTLSAVAGSTGLNTTSIPERLGSYIKIALSLVGISFFILMFYAGFTWMTARGEEERVTKAKNTIIAAVVGISIVVLAYVISSFITGKIGI